MKSVDDVPRLNERDPPVAGHHVRDALWGGKRSILPFEDRVLHRLVLTHRTTLKIYIYIIYNLMISLFNKIMHFP